MNMKRILAFVLTVAITLGIVAATSPWLLSNLRLGLDLKGGFEILYEAQPLSGTGEVTKEALAETAKSLEKRANASGAEEPEVTPEGSNRIRARIAGVTDEAKVRETLRTPASLTFRSADGCAPEAGYCKTELLGTDFKEGAAQVVFDQTNQPIVQIEVKDKAKFEEVTRRLVGKELAIYLDEELLSAPTVQNVFTDGKATITGRYTFSEAKELADTINLGALPLKLTEKYTQAVGASLGQKSLESTVLAGIIGSIAIFVFMIAIYRVPGIVASITLVAYTWLLLLVHYLMNATLTLPGIAAFVLGIGMAVDANIITYERIKEEIRSGKTILSSLKSGSQSSFRTIMDANITTILAGAVLYYVGTGAIKGFAITLILSILISILTNVFFSRFLLWLLIRSNWAKKPEHFGVKPSQVADIRKSKAEVKSAAEGKFDFAKHRNKFFAWSVAVTIAGIVMLAAAGLHLGVDFKAGTTLDVHVGKTIDKAQAEQLVRDAIGTAPESTTLSDSNDRVTMRFDRVLDAESGEANKVKEAFAKAYGSDVSVEENTVDPVIARELARLAVIAIVIASAGIAIYVSIRFEWRFALSAMIALLHDAFAVVSLFAIFRLEVNLPFIAAVLTIIGYSINDKIVIFDRIRENLRFAKLKTSEDLAKLVNESIWQTMTRSINTGLSVIIATIALLIFGSESIRVFSLAMLMGLIWGMYSSICIASQLWILFKQSALKRKTGQASSAEAS
ncbi:protein translocase subunit SecD [Paenibacillus thermoaerophilus]|uniref:Multifunctional fusion protein n=1 Tax=Paenibacillus thermoaerophilus TaxID=1215385 RepID=A0ABW2V1E1_9BACL|nr:protein translocase subunit SecD [Paenibacillus thermoaerophilus]TMV17314.1 protein translocase subunit SecD [Paenibacillus thermoaerophilus]